MGCSIERKKNERAISLIFDAESIDIKAFPLIQQIVNIQMMPINCGPLTRHWYSFKPYKKICEGVHALARKTRTNALETNHSVIHPHISVNVLFNSDATANQTTDRPTLYHPTDNSCVDGIDFERAARNHFNAIETHQKDIEMITTFIWTIRFSNCTFKFTFSLVGR